MRLIRQLQYNPVRLLNFLLNFPCCLFFVCFFFLVFCPHSFFPPVTSTVINHLCFTLIQYRSIVVPSLYTKLVYSVLRTPNATNRAIIHFLSAIAMY
ncbi:hypothetical protein BDV28DRAFT_37313 [Aspergillus coremiiformis]|uniref:Uncharacterized protein n=1 Tax=Aspergillus coremiiformis TaxID=138285 RepID=A0A5N6YZY4_9EURO|nr:hypothetical protein BDV28DRAFT_37313 [Aspergillus coremiiformis]